MKQTNNAIKFLMAQYRAIFKNAYFKGLAAAAVVTMGLAAGAAQAADNVEFYGFKSGIAKGNWGTNSLSAAYKDLNDSNIANTLNTLYVNGIDNLTIASWTAAEISDYKSGGLVHYSGASLAYNTNGVATPSIDSMNLFGKHNIDQENGSLLSDVNSGSLTLGKGSIDLNVVRTANGGGGGGVFAGIALNNGTKQMDLTVRNSTLNVTGERYADHAVVAGYAANSSGTATSIGNTLNYQSTNVKQSNLSAADTYGANLLAGFAQGTHGAIADSNTMNLGTELDNDATVDISQKAFFGGGYAKTLDNANVTNATGTASASNNIVNMSNFAYDTSKRVTEAGSFTYNVNAHIFGGFADNWGDAAKPSKATNATASNNTLTISNAAINTAADYTNTKNLNNLLIRGGLASSDSSGDGTSAINVTASNNTLTINGKLAKNVYSTNLSLLKAGDNIVAGDARQNVGAEANIFATANNNKLTVDTVNLAGGELVGGRANVAKAAKGAGNKDTAEAKNNVVTVTGNTILKNTSINAARVKGSNIIHSGNIANLDSNVVAIADAQKITITGDTTDIKGSVWVKSVVGSEVDFGGVLTDNSKYYNGTGSLTGKLYNQGTVNVYNELDISNGTIYALADKATISVDGSKSAETNESGTLETPEPLTSGFATLKTSEQQIKNYLTAGSATNVILPKETAGAADTKVASSSAGILKVTSGGAVDFGTEVTLSNFNINDTATAGAIVVDGTSAGDSSGSYFKADTLNVQHVLAENATTQTDVDKLTAADASKVHLVANTLNLGSSTLTSEQSKDITFADATVKNQINFNVTSGRDGDQGFILTNATVKGDNYTITNSADSKNEYYTTDSVGTVNGPVRIDTAGELSIVNGDWVANDSITLQGSGALSVGGQNTDPGQLATNNPSLPDATLVVGTTLNIADATSAATTITVTGNTTGNAAYDYEQAQNTLGDDGLSLLDLTAGLEMVDAQGQSKNGAFAGKTTIKAENGGVIILNGSDVSEILAANNATVNGSTNSASGAFFEATAGGALIFANDGGALQVGFNDFDDTDHGIDIAHYGYLAADTINITEVTPSTGAGSTAAPVDESSTWNRNYVDFGANANVYVGDLNVSDLRNSTAGNYVSETGIATGNIYIFGSLSTNNGTLMIGNPDDSATRAKLTFFTPDVSDTSTIAGMSTLQVNNGSELYIGNGKWEANGTIINLASGSLTVGDNDFSYEDLNDHEVSASLTAQGLVVADGSSVKVETGSTATFGTANFSDLAAPSDGERGAVVVYGQMTINDAASTEAQDGTVTYSLFGADGSIYIGKNGTLTFGSAATNHSIIADDQYSGSGSVTAVFDANTDFGRIENQGGTLVLGLADTTTFDADAIVELKHALFTENSFTADGNLLVNGGVLNIGLAHFAGFDVDPVTIDGVDGYTATWDSLEQFADVYSPDVTNYSYTHTNVTGVGLNDQIIGHWGSLSLVPNVATGEVGAQAIIAGDTSLNFAAGNNGFFVSDSSHTTALGAFIKAGKSLSLKEGGTIGQVTLESVTSELGENAVGEAATTLLVEGTGTTYIDSINTRGANSRGTGVIITGTAEVAKNVSVGDLEAIGGSLTVKGDATANYVGVEDHGNLIVNQKLTTSEAFVLGGNLKATDFVFDNRANSGDEDAVEVIDGGVIKAQTFTVNNASHADSTWIRVGADSENVNEYNTIMETDITGTGYFEVGTLTLNGAHFVIDPAYGDATSIASVNKFKDGNESYAYNTVTGTINGVVEIGQNAALGVGTTSIDEVADVIAAFQTNGSLSADKYGSILYLNGQTKLAEGSSIALNAHAQNADHISESLLYSKTDASNKVTQQYADLGLGANTALVLSENAFDNTKGDRAGVALTFERAEANIAGNGGEIVLVGTFDASKKLNFFKDQGAQGHEGVMIHGQDIRVYTQNGFLYTILEAGTEAGYGEQLHVDEANAYNIMSEASDPVVDTLIAYHEDRIDQGSENQSGSSSVSLVEIQDPNTKADQQLAARVGEQQNTEHPVENEQNTPVVNAEVTGNSAFLNEVVANTHGAPAEAAARLAIYGGAVQAAMAATSSTTDAIAARMGVGNTANITMANNGQGAAL